MGNFDRAVPELDPVTQQLITKQRMRMDKPDEQLRADLEAEALSGVDQSRSFQPIMDDLSRQNGQLGGASSTLSEALQSRARKSYDRDLNNMKSGLRPAAHERAFAETQQAGSNALKQLGAASNSYRRLKEAEAARKAARANIIGSVLGAAGAIGGAVLGAAVAGPPGAMVGAQSGSLPGKLGANRSEF